jgi:hypothetical protein
MKLNIGTPLGSTNRRINIRNMTTHFLLKLYYSKTRPVWVKGGRVMRSLTKDQHRAIHNLLRLRAVK